MVNLLLDLQLPVKSVPIMSFNPVRGDVYLIQHYEIKFVSDLRQVGGFLQVSSTCKTDRHDITEILLKVALNTITLTPPPITRQLVIWNFSDVTALSTYIRHITTVAIDSF